MPQWLRFRIHGCPHCDRFLQKRSFVYAKAFAAIALRPCAKSDRGAGDRHSDRPSAAPFCASGLQLDDTPPPVLLVCSTQGIGGIVRIKHKPQNLDRQTSRDRADRESPQQNAFSATLLGSSRYPAKSHRYGSAKDCISPALLWTGSRLNWCPPWARNCNNSKNFGQVTLSFQSY